MVRKNVDPDGNAVLVQIQTGYDRSVAIRNEERFLGGIDLFEIERVSRVLREQPDRAAEQGWTDQKQNDAQKTPTAASAVKTLIGSDGFLLAHTVSMPREKIAYARGSKNGLKRVRYVFTKS